MAVVKDERAAFLGDTRLFGGLEPSLLAEIAALMREVHIAAGQEIFSRGDPGNAIYFVREGRVRISVLTAEGRELAFTHALPGDVFGEIAVIDQTDRSAGATALSSVTALLLSSAATDRLLAAYPEVARAFMRFLCARLRDVSDHLENVAMLPIEARVARFLLDKLPRPSSGPPRERQRVELGMSQTELALLLGASRPKVNAALIALEAAGAIGRVGTLMECDPAILAELAQKQ